MTKTDRAFQISDLGFIEELVDELREVFSIDKDFSEKKFEKQMAVVRGQALNLASAMRFGPNPTHLRTPFLTLYI